MTVLEKQKPVERISWACAQSGGKGSVLTTANPASVFPSHPSNPHALHLRDAAGHQKWGLSVLLESVQTWVRNTLGGDKCTNGVCVPILKPPHHYLHTHSSTTRCSQVQDPSPSLVCMAWEDTQPGPRAAAHLSHCWPGHSCRPSQSHCLPSTASQL